MITALTAKLLAWADDDTPQGGSLLRKLWHSICRIVLITILELRRNELSLRASALTYTVMLSLVPLLAMSTAVVKGLGGGDQLRTAIYSYVETLDQGTSSPRTDNATAEDPVAEDDSSDLTQHLYDAVDRIFNYVDNTNFTTLGTIGVIGMVISVVFVFGNIEAAMNSIWHVESGRSIMRKVADYLALLVLMPISINIGFAASAILKSDALLSHFTHIFPLAWVQSIVLMLIPIFFLTMTLFVIYLFFPHTKVKTIPALTGALFAGFFWFQVQNLYISLQVGVSRYNAIYGSFATLPLFLIWIYCGWLFILTGAQIAYAFQHSKGYRLLPVEAQPSMRLSIAFDIMTFVEECFRENRHSRLDDFLNKYPMHEKNLVDEAAADLIRHQLIHLSESDASLKPSTAGAGSRRSEIITAILGSGFSTTTGGRESSAALSAATSPPGSSQEEKKR